MSRPVALITGAAHGQGRVTAVALAQEGYDVVALDVARELEYPGYPMGSAEELGSLPAELEPHGAACLTVVADVRDDPHHHVREALDSMLAQLAHDLQHDPAAQERTERLKERLLDHPQVLASSISLWNALRRSLQSSLTDPEGAVRTRLLDELTAFGRRLVDDQTLRERLDGLAADAAVFGVERYGAEVTTVITHTIERWDGKEAARRIELHVGRDLQFIRINGTIVGGLVGVLIHTIAVVLH